MKINNELSIEEVKAIIFKILVDFDCFCKKNDLNYSLAGGTLLGAVRHKGFIPWDDDIDVYMPRKDYDFLLKHYNKHGKKNGYKIISNKNHGFYMMISKIIDVNTVAVEANRYEKIGVWIDILPVEYINEMPENLKDKMYSYSEDMYYLGRREFLKTNCFLKKIEKTIIRTFKKIKIRKNYYRILHDYQGNNNICFYSKRRKKVWSVLPNDLGFCDKECRLEFEGKSFQVMKKWKEYLNIYFGTNYMELPPENERVSHECALRIRK